MLKVFAILLFIVILHTLSMRIIIPLIMIIVK